MLEDDIKDYPAYMCNKRGLQLGAVAAAIAATISLSYPPPNNLYVFVCVALLSTFFFLTERFLLPSVKTFKALDSLVVGYCTLILSAQLFTLWCFPEAESSTALGCMVVLSALHYHSTLLMTLYILVTVASWMLMKSMPFHRLELEEMLQRIILAKA